MGESIDETFVARAIIINYESWIEEIKRRRHALQREGM